MARWDDGTECFMCRILPVQWQKPVKSYRCAVRVGMGEQGEMRAWERWVPSSSRLCGAVTQTNTQSS